MIQEEKDYVLSTIDNEGFDYTFTSYSNFKDIECEKFHELRLNYLEAVKKMTDYLENK